MTLVVKITRTIKILILILAPLLLISCGKQSVIRSIGGETMGTTYSVKYVEPDNGSFTPNILLDKINLYLIEFNKIFSTYDNESEISALNRKPNKLEKVKVSDDLKDQILNAIEIYQFTGQTFDPSVGPLINLWNFGYPQIADDDFVVPTPEEVEKTLLEIGMDKIKFANDLLMMPNNLQLNFSAIAKGRAVDELGKLLENEGINHFLVEIGGEVTVKGNKLGKNDNKEISPNHRWKVLISNPVYPGDSSQFDNQSLIIDLKGKSLATSGDYQNYYERDGVRYSHTIDPRNGYPIKHNLASVSVIDDSCERADALATAIMVMGEVDGRKFIEENNLKAFLIYRDGKVFKNYISENFQPFVFK